MPPSSPLGTPRLVFALVTAAGFAGAVTLFILRPGGSQDAFLPKCPFHYVTGLHCPGCGTMRGLHALLHGRVGTAFGLNPLMMLALPFMTYAYVSYGVFALRGRPLPGPGPMPGLIWGLFFLVIAYWIARNVPVAPFSYLAP